MSRSVRECSECLRVVTKRMNDQREMVAGFVLWRKGRCCVNRILLDFGHMFLRGGVSPRHSVAI